jgi:uncharacterized membrane protein HdeD (DUF308 family)
MIYLCYMLFGLGFISYIVAAFNVGSDTGETLSDIGNALMLITAVLLLFRAARWGRKS